MKTLIMNDSQQSLFNGNMTSSMLSHANYMLPDLRDKMREDDFPYRIRSFEDLRGFAITLVNDDEDRFEDWIDKKLKVLGMRTPRILVEEEDWAPLERLIYFCNNNG